MSICNTSSGSKKAKFRVKNNLIDLNVNIKGNEKYGFTVFSYTNVFITLKSLQIYITQYFSY